MEDVFPIIESLFDQQFSRAYFIGILAGAAIWLCGMIVIAIVMISVSYTHLTLPTIYSV